MLPRTRIPAPANFRSSPPRIFFFHSPQIHCLHLPIITNLLVLFPPFTSFSLPLPLPLRLRLFAFARWPPVALLTPYLHPPPIAFAIAALSFFAYPLQLKRSRRLDRAIDLNHFFCLRPPREPRPPSFYSPAPDPNLWIYSRDSYSTDRTEITDHRSNIADHKLPNTFLPTRWLGSFLTHRLLKYIHAARESFFDAQPPHPIGGKGRDPYCTSICHLTAHCTHHLSANRTGWITVAELRACAP